MQDGKSFVFVGAITNQMAHSDFSYVITVPHPKKQLGKGLVNAILKSAKLKE